MSVQPSQSSGDGQPAGGDGQPAGGDGQPAGGDGQPAGGDGRRFSTLIGSLAAATSPNRADRADAKPTFTAGASGPAVAVPPEPTDTPKPADTPEPGTPAGAPAPVSGPGTETGTGPGTGLPARPTPPAVPPPSSSAAAPAAPAAPDKEGTRVLPRPAAAAAVDEPLLGDVVALRARWQRVQAGFVDDPQEAVGDAADLIEQTAQALVGALRQRQRQLRVMWERGQDPAPQDTESAAERVPDTEHLRLMMQRYRALFNQLCRP